MPGPAAVTPRVLAVRSAAADWLNPDFLDAADEPTLRGRLLTFYEAVVDPPLHCEVLARRVGLVRHGLNHLLRGGDPLPVKFDRCAQPLGAYSVPGLGLAFWGAIVQATDPDTIPGLTPATDTRSGSARAVEAVRPRYVGVASQSDAGGLRPATRADPEWTATDIDDFLSRIAATRGRELASRPPTGSEVVEDLVRRVRSKLPLRERLKAHLPARQAAHPAMAAALARSDAAAVREVLQTLGPGDEGMHDEALLDWATRLWVADDPYPVLADYWQTATLLGGGPWLPAAVLHLKEPRRSPLWDDDARAGLAAVDDGYDPAGPSAEGYRLFAEGCDELRRRFRLHPLEVPDVLRTAVRDADEPARPDAFDGFCTDTFRFLADLDGTTPASGWPPSANATPSPSASRWSNCAGPWRTATSSRSWTATSAGTWRRRRSRPGPVERRQERLRPIGPVRADPVDHVLPPAMGGKRDDVQLFVRLDARGVAAGLRLGRKARDAGRRFRKNVQEHAEPLYRALAATDAFARCRFLGDDGQPVPIQGPADLREWAAGKTLIAERLVPAADPLVRGDDLVGDILLTFDRLLPAYRCAVDDDPRPGGGSPPAPVFDADEFRRDDVPDADWLRTAMGLLALKRQLILQGVPGTGKTHVARCLARLLTGGAEERVRLVQFHPAYSYEEFVEGIKARTVEVDGRHEVTYPVEDGVLCRSPRRPRPGRRSRSS